MVGSTGDVYNTLWTNFGLNGKKQYLSDQQSRQKWQKSKPNIGVGDVVLLKDDNATRGVWSLCLVVKTYPGKDGKTCSVRVRVGDRTLDKSEKE